MSPLDAYTEYTGYTESILVLTFHRSNLIHKESVKKYVKTNQVEESNKRGKGMRQKQEREKNSGLYDM